MSSQEATPKAPGEEIVMEGDTATHRILDEDEAGQIYMNSAEQATLIFRPEYKSEIKIAPDFSVYTTKRIGWWNRMWYRLIFGWRVETV